MRLKRERWFDMHKAMGEILPLSKSVKFNYAVLQIKQILETERKMFMEAIRPPEEYLEFERKRLELCRRYATKDENGLPMREGNGFQIKKESVESLLMEIETLRKEYEGWIAEAEEKDIQAKKMLDEEIDLNVRPIPLSIIPEDVVYGNHLEELFPVISEEQ